MVAAARVVRTPREVLPLREVPPVLPQPPAHLRTTEPPKRLATVELGGAAPEAMCAYAPKRLAVGAVQTADEGLHEAQRMCQELSTTPRGAGCTPPPGIAAASAMRSPTPKMEPQPLQPLQHEGLTQAQRIRAQQLVRTQQLIESPSDELTLPSLLAVGIIGELPKPPSTADESLTTEEAHISATPPVMGAPTASVTAALQQVPEVPRGAAKVPTVSPTPASAQAEVEDALRNARQRAESPAAAADPAAQIEASTGDGAAAAAMAPLQEGTKAAAPSESASTQMDPEVAMALLKAQRRSEQVPVATAGAAPPEEADLKAPSLQPGALHAAEVHPEVAKALRKAHRRAQVAPPSEPAATAAAAPSEVAAKAAAAKAALHASEVNPEVAEALLTAQRRSERRLSVEEIVPPPEEVVPQPWRRRGSCGSRRRSYSAPNGEEASAAAAALAKAKGDDSSALEEEGGGCESESKIVARRQAWAGESARRQATTEDQPATQDQPATENQPAMEVHLPEESQQEESDQERSTSPSKQPLSPSKTRGAPADARSAKRRLALRAYKAELRRRRLELEHAHERRRAAQAEAAQVDAEAASAEIDALGAAVSAWKTEAAEALRAAGVDELPSPVSYDPSSPAAPNGPESTPIPPSSSACSRADPSLESPPASPTDAASPVASTVSVKTMPSKRSSMGDGSPVSRCALGSPAQPSERRTSLRSSRLAVEGLPMLAKPLLAPPQPTPSSQPTQQGSVGASELLLAVREFVRESPHESPRTKARRALEAAVVPPSNAASGEENEPPHENGRTSQTVPSELGKKSGNLAEAPMLGADEAPWDGLVIDTGEGMLLALSSEKRTALRGAPFVDINAQSPALAVAVPGGADGPHGGGAESSSLSPTTALANAAAAAAVANALAAPSAKLRVQSASPATPATSAPCAPKVDGSRVCTLTAAHLGQVSGAVSSTLSGKLAYVLHASSAATLSFTAAVTHTSAEVSARLLETSARLSEVAARASGFMVYPDEARRVALTRCRCLPRAQIS